MQDPLSILQKYWGYDAFRPMQQEIISHVLQSGHALALLPTGGGKSLCYQLPALMQEGCCLVISPLVALMQDQVARLKQLGIPAAAIHAGMHYLDVKRTLQNTIHGGYKLLYISPERLQSDMFGQYLPELNLSLIAVDEAHCISQWGHDFRPDYLKIVSLRELFPQVPVLALTATATPEVVRDITTQLRLPQPVLFRQSFSRDNIFYDVRYSENKRADLLTAVEAVTSGSTIIYCRSRKQTVAVANYLQQMGHTATYYHAGIPKEARDTAQAEWMQGKTPIIVATTAFGMGIDKAEVRLVVHYDMPEDLEAYYQEAGRAGRDGAPATALLLHNVGDIRRLHEGLELQFPKTEYLRQVYQCVAEYLQIPIGNEPDTYYDFDLYVFCDRFGLQALQASYALKILAQEGLWTMTESVFRPATIVFTTDRSTLDDIARQYPELSKLVTLLLRMYTGILTYPAKISLYEIATALRISKDQLPQQLAALHRMEVLEYMPQAQGPQLYFHHRRTRSNNLIINTKRIAALRKKRTEKIAAIERFTSLQTGCREWALLDYFGEAHPAKPCGHCDLCEQQSASKKPKVSLNVADVLRHFREIEYMTIGQALALFEKDIQEEVLGLIRRLIDEGQLQMQGQTLSRKR